MDKLKIYVYGFAHSGTTILRKIIGDHPSIVDYPEETYDPPDLDRVVFKCPELPDYRHKDCRRVMIMRNPYDIFGGYYLRYGKDYLSIPGRGIGDYMMFFGYFSETKDYKVRYEDLFKEGTLENLFTWLGLEFEGIKTRKAYCSDIKMIPKVKPKDQKEGKNHALYRTWQINQPFRNMTGESAKFLPEDTRKLLTDIWKDYS